MSSRWNLLILCVGIIASAQLKLPFFLVFDKFLIFWLSYWKHQYKNVIHHAPTSQYIFLASVGLQLSFFVTVQYTCRTDVIVDQRLQQIILSLNIIYYNGHLRYSYLQCNNKCLRFDEFVWFFHAYAYT